jgi:hypothetical protein
MAHAKICDRCGNVYGKNKYKADFGDNKYGTVKGVCVMFEETNRGLETRKNAYLDLCDDCIDMLNFFLQDKNAKVSST